MTQVDDISASLRRYISLEERDAEHCMKHFIKVEASDPEAATDLLPATLEHLTLIR